jgi:nitrite reductase/ring-hydroxylating ferredoxin subunit
MEYLEIARKGDVSPGSMKAVSVKGKDLLLSNVDGNYHVIGGKCTHMHGDLSKGILAGKIVTCPRHGSQFDVTSGTLLAGPAKNNEPVYEIKIEGESIKVGI